MFTKFVKAAIALVLLVGSTLPLAASAAPATDTTPAPASHELAARGIWVCEQSWIPPGYLRTRVRSGINNMNCGISRAFYIEPFDPNRQLYLVCGGWIPEGWIIVGARYVPPVCGDIVQYEIWPFQG